MSTLALGRINSYDGDSPVVWGIRVVISVCSFLLMGSSWSVSHINYEAIFIFSILLRTSTWVYVQFSQHFKTTKHWVHGVTRIPLVSVFSTRNIKLCHTWGTILQRVVGWSTDENRMSCSQNEDSNRKNDHSSPCFMHSEILIFQQIDDWQLTPTSCMWLTTSTSGMLAAELLFTSQQMCLGFIIIEHTLPLL